MSCAVKMKNEKKAEVVSVKKIGFAKPDNWADSFYHKTQFILSNPKVLNTYKQLDKICKGPEFDFMTDYQTRGPAPIKFKKEKVTITTASGFSKKVYVSKGVCRELSLFKAPKTAKDGQIRINIEEMKILYIYNFGSYVEDVTFRTAYKGVKFFVK